MSKCFLQAGECSEYCGEGAEEGEYHETVLVEKEDQEPVFSGPLPLYRYYSCLSPYSYYCYSC